MPAILVFDRVGGPENLRFRDVPLPVPGPGEVRYQVHAFALNRGDLFWLSGTYYNEPVLPSRIGQEACGIVDAVGAGVARFKKGDRVSSLVQEEGRYCVNGEFAITPERYLVPWPDGLSAEEGCSLWSQALTAYYPFVEHARVRPGQNVLVTAGSSTSGNGAIQMAKLLGACVLATSRTLAKREFLLRVGADVVMPTVDTDLGELMHERTEGRGVDVVFDTVAGSLMPRYLKGLAANANVYIVGALEGALDLSGSILDLVRTGGSITGFSVFNHNRIDEHLARAKRFIEEAIKTRKLRAIVDRVFTFEETIAAYEYLKSGQQTGKVVVRVRGTPGHTGE